MFYIYLCDMNLENSKAQMRKGILEYCILTIISNGEIYASEIIARLKKANLIVVEGTLYPLLTRLKNTGLIAYRWEESNAGPPRKYFQLTETGQAFLNELHKTWEELNQSVSQSISKSQKTDQ